MTESYQGGTPLGYVVVTWNQASYQPDIDGWGMHADVESAVLERDDMRAMTKAANRGERHRVCAVIEYRCDPCDIHTDPDQPITCTDQACACWCNTPAT